MLKILQYNILIFFTVFMVGCTTVSNVPLDKDFWKKKDNNIVVVTKKPPTPELYFVGQQGLLEVAIASVFTRKINENIKKHDLSWYSLLAKKFTHQLKLRGIKATLDKEMFNGSQKNYKQIQAQFKANQLLLIEVDAVGAIRSYYSVFPTGAPQAHIRMKGELINIDDNSILWRHQISLNQPISVPWDQPPNYPNLNKALNEAIDIAKEELIDSFFSGH